MYLLKVYGVYFKNLKLKGDFSNYLWHVKSIVLNTFRMTHYEWIDTELSALLLETSMKDKHLDMSPYVLKKES